MTTAREPDTLALLEREREALLSAIASIPPARRAERPGVGRWSAAEVLEHLATVERGVVKLIARRGQDPPPAGAPPPPLEASRVDRLRGRDERIAAPERVQPTGSVNAEDSLRALENTRAALCEAFRAANPQALDGCTYEHPVLGTLTLRDWVHFVAHHEARHVAQIREIATILAR